MSQLEVGTGRTRVRLTWRRHGRDLHVHIGGGGDHIGVVALAGQAEDGDPYAQALRIPPHKEDRLALAAAGKLHAAAGINVCVTAGIHLEGITRAEIAEITRNAEAAIQQLAGVLPKPGSHAEPA
jgi:hypothetical protein